jgi:hypothetical protein
MAFEKVPGSRRMGAMPLALGGRTLATSIQFLRYLMNSYYQDK